MNNHNRCPRCSEGLLKDWQELSDQEQEVVKRLPGSADYSDQERLATHRWCTRCWFEATESQTEA